MSNAKTQKLDAYRGPLSASEIAAGINLANANAWRLFEDASTLLELGRFPTAASLAALSIEESGKVSILRTLALAKTKEDVSIGWKSYRSHTKKNVKWTLPDLARSGARTLEDLRPLFDEASDHPYVLDQVKQLGFYSDCLGNRNWADPAYVIDEATSRTLVNTAKLLAGKSEVTCREIELWIEHIGGASLDDFEAGKKALVAWYAAMQAEGLKEEGMNMMEQFVNNGIQLPQASKTVSAI